VGLCEMDHLAQDGTQWPAVVNTVTKKAGNSLTE